MQTMIQAPPPGGRGPHLCGARSLLPAFLSLLAWFLLDGFAVRIGFSRQVLRPTIDLFHWQPHWPLLPCLLGGSGLLAAGLLHRRGRRRAPLHRYLQQLGRLGLALLSLRLLSLWDPLGGFLPYLGLLWAPHATWALALVWALAPLSAGVTFPSLSPGRSAGVVFAACALLYGAYALYFCQMAMLHGDEGHYLRVTQSLLHDGDMDLANNLSPGQVAEFHVIDFAVHKAPASPPGKVYSVHPVGLSALLVPAYWLGLEWWGNPRLGAALFMALLAAACMGLALWWLRRLGAGSAAALLSVAIAATTPPFFLFSNQLYPEVPALLLLLLVLAALSHWQVPGGGYRNLGRWEPALLGGLTLGLGLLPFLHPRFLAAALPPGALVLLQAGRSPRRALNLAAAGLAAAAALGVLLAFNFAFSGDWMGPFRPGNAWGGHALEPATWLRSLPGQWLHDRKGLLNSAPVFALALLGWALLALRRDRRAGVAAVLYGSTALVNGLHPDWTFGFGFAARFMLAATPALLLGLAWGLRRVLERPAALWLAALALVLSWESALETAKAPEIGYEGRNLPMRSFNEYYPWELHFIPPGHSGFPWSEVCFWALLLGGALYLLHRPVRLPARAGVIALMGLTPFIWGRSPALSQRLGAELSPYLLLPNPDTGSMSPLQVDFTPTREYHHTTGTRQSNGSLSARQGRDKGGLLASYHMPFLRPGLYQLSLSGLRLAGDTGQVPGHILVVRRRLLPARGPWEERLSMPLHPDPAAARTLIFPMERSALGYAYVDYSGFGQLALRRFQISFFPQNLFLRREKIHRFSFESAPGKGDLLRGAVYPDLAAGRYNVRFELEGQTASTLFERAPEPVFLAVYSGAGGERLRRLAMDWFGRDTAELEPPQEAHYLRPQIESVQPPWWAALAFVHPEAYDLGFTLNAAGDVWFLLKYRGTAELHLKGISLYRRTLVKKYPP